MGGAPFRERLGELWPAVRALGDAARFDAGEIVLRRGDPPTWVLVVEEGALDVVDPRTSPPTVLATRGPGQVLGEMSFVDGSPVSAEVRAHPATVCVRFRVAELASGLARDPAVDAAFHRALAATLGARIRSLTTSAVTGGFGSRSGDRESTRGASAGGPDPHLAALLAPRPAEPVALRGERLTVGRGAGADVRLDLPGIGALHAELVRAEEGWRVVSRADRAVAVNGAPVSSAALVPGATVSFGRARFRVEPDRLEPLPAWRPFAVHAERLTRRVGGRTLLDGVDLTLLAGEVVALVGPSGAGKSTLLAALSGTTPADEGVVRVDGEPLGALLARVPTAVGEVPQDDIVLPELTVEESLRFAARLRAPRDGASAREASVNRVITALGLDGVRSSRIGDPLARGVSGGQRKRVNLGQELVTDATRILFLDEPTSGLDPKSAEDLARLARQLADDGRVVVLVTHDLSDALVDQVDQLIVMAPGGRLAWFGPPAEALAHFGVASVPRIFGCLADLPSEAWAERYRTSDAARTYGAARRAACDAAWPAPDLASAPPPGLPAQLVALTARAALAKLRDRTAVAVLVVQPLMVGAVAELVFPRATSGLVFLLALAALWFGMSAAVRELIVDRASWRRERRIGASPVAWVGAKAAVLAVAVGLQCAALAALAFLAVDLAAAGFGALPLAASLVLTGWTGAATGLWVSTWWQRSDAAVGTLVLLLVPQIAFVGMLTPLDQLAPLGRALSWAAPLRYALHLALARGERLAYLKLGEWHERPVGGELFLLGLRPSGDGLGLPTSTLVGVLTAFLLAQLVGAVLGMRRDR